MRTVSAVSAVYTVITLGSVCISHAVPAVRAVLAVRAVRLGLGRAATVTLGWHPGDAAPARVSLDVDGAPRPIEALGPAALSIQGTWQELGLGQVRFADYSDGGWFQRPAPWEFDRPQFQGAA